MKQLKSMIDAAAQEIVSVDCFPVRLPLVKPITTSTHHITYGESMYVRITTRDGQEGWGESGADAIMAGETLPGIRALIDQHLRPHLLGASPFDRIQLAARFERIYANGGAKAAIDIALLDLAGKALGTPAVELLGGAARRSVRVLRLIGGSRSTKLDVEEAQAFYTQGFRAFKLKVGVTTVEAEAETVVGLRQALGPETTIAVDANMGWDTTQAKRFLRLTRDCNLQFVEQPVAAGDVARMASVSASSATPIGADESIHGVQDILTYGRAHAISGVSLKAAKLGGPTPMRSAGTLADALGLCVNVAMLVESSVATSAMVHTACALPQIDWALSLGSLWLAHEPGTASFSIENGHAQCTGQPGIGIEVQEADLRRYHWKNS